MARLHRDVLRVLASDIVSGRRATGELLPREVDVSEQFGVSRGVARETIRAMEERGLVTVKHGKGATVNPAERWSVFDPDVFAAMLEGERATEVLTHYLECRRILEVEAAGLAAERADEEDLREAADALRRMEESASGPPGRSTEERFHAADVAFHGALVEAAGNRALGGLVDRLHAALLIARHALAQPRFRIERALPEHRRILEAVVAGDPAEARAAMRDHLDTVASYLREQEAARG
jgi:DNA-binding FadR family transcriptional regulator